VIEVDGRQHYSSGDKNQFAEDDAAERVNEFFEALLSRHRLQA
jgi:hypothetical protein